MSIFFDLPHLYYLPQYAPVINELRKRNIECSIVLYTGNDLAVKQAAVAELGIANYVAKNHLEAAKIYHEHKPQWVVFGNAFEALAGLQSATKSALVFHGSGTGVKSAPLIAGLKGFDVRFVSGPGRMKIFAEHFPNTTMVQVGFAKLDPILNDTLPTPRIDLVKVGLDPHKPTLLYSPTFYPSSIENMPKHFPQDFADYNILIKCHDFTLNKPKYRHQLKKVLHWATYQNVYLAKPSEYSLVPYMATADLMVTDTSSSMFEFAALNKPVITCGFFHVRWTYRGPFRYKWRKRIDASTKHYLAVAENVERYAQLVTTLQQHLAQPELLEKQRLEYADEIMGPRDGKAAIRIADYLCSNLSAS